MPKHLTRYILFNIVLTKIMELPKDPMMLLSFINMKLRDFYPSLDDLCNDLDIDKKTLVKQLQTAGFEYNPAQNKFW